MNIYKMKLHERITLFDDKYKLLITRVAGGWIYERQEPSVNLLHQVFVPFNNEFIMDGKQ
jgi:hypothetical protein